MAIAQFSFLGALAYRSAKRRWLGEVRSTMVRRILEGIAILLILGLWLRLNNLRDLIVTQPVPYGLAPLWALIAYAFMGFRSRKVVEPAKDFSSAGPA